MAANRLPRLRMLRKEAADKIGDIVVGSGWGRQEHRARQPRPPGGPLVAHRAGRIVPRELQRNRGERMNQTYEIRVVIDDEGPLEKRRAEARIAAAAFYDQITGDGERRLGLLMSAAQTFRSADDVAIEKLTEELRLAKLCLA